jgi:4-aminobutyrate aminotransferase/(S)-3-amino-2-methylpropionate transaminase
MKCGTHDNVVRLMPPLVIGDEDLNQGLDVLIESLRWAAQSA